MPFDINNNYTGNFFGKDRLGFTTPDLDASDPVQPFLPVGYPAPWLPIRRRDTGHPVGAGVVISSHQLVGLDASGALVPAGLWSGVLDVGASGPKLACILKYGLDDVGSTLNPITGQKVAADGEVAVIGVSSTVTAGDVIDGVTITTGMITDATNAAPLIPGQVARPIGYAIRNVFQFLGGVDIVSASPLLYRLDAANPAKYQAHNYIHEMATAVRTQHVIRLPWIGATPDAISQLAAADNVAGYAQTLFGRSFAHFVGSPVPGMTVVAANRFGAFEAGNYTNFDPEAHTPDMIAGRVLGVEQMYPIRGYADRVRTQFERAPSFIGPFREPNPNQIMMGGSATRGMDYAIHLTTDGIFRKAVDQNKTVHPEYCTYVYVHVRC